MKQTILTVTNQTRIADGVYKMTLSGDCTEIKRPGQFVNFALDGLFLRRPISVCDSSGDSVTVIYKTVGAGTEKMAQMTAGDRLDTLVGLGNGFDTSKSGDRPLLVGGGCGLPPLYKLCKDLLREGKRPVVIGGFNSKKDAFLEDEFNSLGVEYRISTVDGSLGKRGFVTDVLQETGSYTFFYSCGPIVMMKNLSALCPTSGEVSLEARMGCGFGACMGCTCETVSGGKRICKDGPVFQKEEVLWQNFQ